ncbi:MAG: branched-chain amino acid ABC transporter permease [Thermodesulfobacteriota bacterium]
MMEFVKLVISGMMIGGLYALVGAAVVLVYKSTEVVSLAHGQLLAFGALLFWIFLVPLGFPLWFSLLLTFAFAASIGLLVERFAMRPLIGQPAFTAFLMTFAVFVAMDGVFQLILAGESRAYPSFLHLRMLKIGGLGIPLAGLLSFGLVLLLFLILAGFFRYTKTGLGMRATADDHQLAQATGIRVRNIFSIIWIISAVVAAVAGIATANVMDIYYPLPYIGIKGLIVALCGGLNSLAGALLGGLMLGVLEEMGAGYLDPIVGGGVKEVAAYVMLLLVLLIKPYGFFGLIRIERI